MLANGEGDAFVSAGSTGAIVVGASLFVKRIKGIKRAALATVIRRRTAAICCSTWARTRNAVGDARAVRHYGSAYMEHVMGVRIRASA